MKIEWYTFLSGIAFGIPIGILVCYIWLCIKKGSETFEDFFVRNHRIIRNKGGQD